MLSVIVDLKARVAFEGPFFSGDLEVDPNSRVIIAHPLQGASPDHKGKPQSARFDVNPLWEFRKEIPAAYLVEKQAVRLLFECPF